MQRYFYIIIFFLVITSLSNPQGRSDWRILNSPVNTILRNIIFVDNLTGWAAGEAGVIIHTSDGGESWEIQNSTIQTWISDIFFINKNIGWAVSFRDVSPFNTIILKTTDGGKNWIAEDYPDLNAFMVTIYFLDPMNGFLGGSYIARTSDGGLTWQQADVDSSFISGLPVLKFRFYNEQFGYACGGFIDFAGVIWRTTDGGLNWSASGVSADEVFDLFIFDLLNAVALSGDPEGIFPIWKIRTTNGGEDWSDEELSFYGLTFDIDFRTATEGWTASGHRFLYSTDTGNTWIEQVTPDSVVIKALQFTDRYTGYGTGEQGAIIKYVPNPLDIKEETDLPDNFILYQNYPNPFNPTTKLSFIINKPSFVNLKIYDFLGQEIATLINEEKPAGNYDIIFNADEYNLSSGVYLYKLIAGEFTDTKKFLFLK